MTIEHFGDFEKTPFPQEEPKKKPKEKEADKTAQDVASSVSSLLSTKGGGTVIDIGSHEKIIGLQKTGKGQEFPLDKPTVDKIVDSVIKELTGDKKVAEEDVLQALHLQEMRETISEVVSYALVKKASGSTGYFRPNVTQLRIPFGINEKGNIVVFLKKKVGEEYKLGTGQFKVVKGAFSIAFEEAAKVRVTSDANATISARSPENKKALEIEKAMALTLVEEGHKDPNDPPVGIVETKEVIVYNTKASETAPEREKIGVLTQKCNGGDLEKRIVDGEHPLTPQEQITYAKDVLSGVAWLQRHEIAHLDLKPSNILLHNVRAKVGDFGCGRNMKDPTQRVYVNGDNTYSSPELRAMKTHLLQLMNPEHPGHDKALILASKELDSAKDKVHQLNLLIKAKEERYEELPSESLADEITAHKEELKEAKEDLQRKAIAYNKRGEEVSKEALKIDETIFKADDYAAGIILAQIFFGLSQNDILTILRNRPMEEVTRITARVEAIKERLTPSMRNIITGLLHPQPEERLSAGLALELFTKLEEKPNGIYASNVQAPVEKAHTSKTKETKSHDLGYQILQVAQDVDTTEDTTEEIKEIENGAALEGYEFGYVKDLNERAEHGQEPIQPGIPISLFTFFS